MDMGDWVGGQAEYVLVPYADFNLLKLPYRDASMEKIRDLTCLSDILPTGYHGAVTAGVGPGSTVYIAGAGPVGLAAAASAPAALMSATAILAPRLASSCAMPRPKPCAPPVTTATRPPSSEPAPAETLAR